MAPSWQRSSVKPRWSRISGPSGPSWLYPGVYCSGSRGYHSTQPWRRSCTFQQSTRVSSRNCSHRQFSISWYSSYRSYVSSGTFRGSTSSACTGHRRIISCRRSRSLMSRITGRGWSSSRRRSGRSGRCNACGSRGDTHSPRRTRARRGCCRRTIPRREGAGMGRWRARDRGGSPRGEGEACCKCITTVYENVPVLTTCSLFLPASSVVARRLGGMIRTFLRCA